MPVAMINPNCYTEFNFKSQRTEAIPMRTFHLNSLRNKLILFLLTSMILPISISILITYLYTKESIKSYYIRENSNLIHQGAINFRNYMDRINEATLLIYNNLSDANSLYQLIQNGSHTYMEEREMYRNLQFIANSVKEIEQIYLYSAAEDTSYRYAYKLLRSTPGQTYDPRIEPGQDVRVEAAHASHEYGIAKPKFPVPYRAGSHFVSPQHHGSAVRQHPGRDLPRRHNRRHPGNQRSAVHTGQRGTVHLR